MCARLAQRQGDVERCQEYGLSGQRQEGIDILIRLRESSEYSVWQCKRYRKVKPSTIEDAVSAFLRGSWASRARHFAIALTVSTEDVKLAEVIEEQAARLRGENINFLPLGISELSAGLKDFPDLVDDFFGREWVRRFCGDEAAATLSRRRLRPEEVIRLRKLLRSCYAEHFQITDPGLPSFPGRIGPDYQPLPLVDRFVSPDVLETQQVAQTPVIQEDEQGGPTEIPDQAPVDQNSGPARNDKGDNPSVLRARVVARTSEVRSPAIHWLSGSHRSVVLGDPGIGKTTLLRCVLLDLLSQEPRYEVCAVRWGQYLPVWIPFPMWTRLVAESETECSLSDVLTAWLKKVNAEADLIKLVQEALEDSRLLLFVDGLDEWSDETAARTTLMLLEQFVGVRDVPAIASSRPLGYVRLGGLSSKWRKAQLAGLTSEQQRILTERWFVHRSNAIAPGDEESHSQTARQTRARAEATEHMQDLHSDVRLSRLAEVPLLLCGLIALAIRNVHLPRNRFKAYEELTHLLLEEQPKRRASAAYARRTSGSLSEENRERALARLAWEIHGSPGSDALERSVAIQAVRDFCQTHLYKSPGDGLEIAEELLSIGAEAVGVLIEKSSVEIGFLHRSFQEFLAAKHLSNLPFEEQRKVVGERFRDPQWHDVLLCLSHLNTRSGEVDALISIVEEMELPIELEFGRQRFLAQIAFGDLHCSPSVARRLAEDTFEAIEVGVQEGTHGRLVELALDGLESDTLRSLVEGRIREWYPLRHRSRRGLYQAAAKGRKTDGAAAILWRGLLDDEHWNRRAAAESLAKILRESPSEVKKGYALLFKPAEPRLVACVLHALCLGPKCDRLAEILRNLRQCPDGGVQSVALIHRVGRNEHDLDDRKVLIESLRHRGRGSWEWAEDRARALIEGWPGDPEIRQIAIDSVGKPYLSQAYFEWNTSGIILLEGFPRDQDVGEAVARLFQREEYPGHPLGIGSNWSRLRQVVACHEALGVAVDDWLERRMEERGGELFWDFELCAISHSVRAKGFLLKPDEETGVISEYQARWLLQGWGMEDEEASEALIELARSGAARAVADLLPKIVEDREECRGFLLEVLRNESEQIARRALIGLVRLGANGSDEEVVEVGMERYSEQVPSGAAFWGVSDLIEYFREHGRVQELALYQLRNRSGDLNTVAGVYGGNSQIRCELFGLGNSLSADLRLIVVERLARLAPEDDFAHDTLSKYDEDIDANVKTAAAVGFSRSVKRRGWDERVEILNELSGRLGAIGPDLRERRQAAFAALVELDRLDIVEDVLTGGELGHLGLGTGVTPNLRLAELVGKHLRRVTELFGGDFWARVGWAGEEFLGGVAAHSTEPDLVDEILELPVRGEEVAARPALVQLYSREWRGTVRLRELCLTLVRGFGVSSWVDTAPGLYAAEVLGEQFSNDATAGRVLESLVGEGRMSSALVIAIGTGWRDTEVWGRLSREAEVERLLLPARLCLIGADASPAEFLGKVSESLGGCRGHIWEFLPLCSRAVGSRFGRDQHVRELALSRLERQATSFEKMNFPSLLFESGEKGEELRNWMRSEIRRQSEGVGLPEVALDLHSGSVRSVCQVLLEQLTA